VTALVPPDDHRELEELRRVHGQAATRLGRGVVELVLAPGLLYLALVLGIAAGSLLPALGAALLGVICAGFVLTHTVGGLLTLRGASRALDRLEADRQLPQARLLR
jgi:hypothetical protein